MPVPVIAAAAAAAAARLAAKKIAQAAGKQVVKATLGKNSAAKYAAQKAASNVKTSAASSRNAKKAAETRAALKSAKSKPPLATPKSNVQTKPARKPVGNPPNDTKAWENYIDSVSRGAPGMGRGAGKAKATRVANSKIAKKTVPSAKEPSRIPEIPARETVRINSAKTTGVVRVNPKKVTSSSRNSFKKKSLTAEKKSLTAVRQRIDTDAIAGNSVKIKPSAETKAKLSKARQEKYLKRSSKREILKTPVKKVPNSLKAKMRLSKSNGKTYMDEE